ncbi:hypothetical protein LCGC14_2965680, partial [marine sediment metagenome]
IRFDKVYSEKNFERDCWYVQELVRKKLLNPEQIDLVVYFWVGQLKPVDRNIKKVAKETAKYITFLKKVEKRDAKQIDKQ